MTVTPKETQLTSSRLKQLELERNQLMEQYQEEKIERESAQNKLHNMQHELANQGNLS